MQTLIDRANAPQINQILGVSVKQAEKFSLDNGIPVYTIHAGLQDLVKVEFIFFNNQFDIKNPILNSATNRMLAEGTSKYSSQELADKIDYYGAFFETDENSDYTSVVLFTLNKYLEATLPFIGEIIHDASFPQIELGVYIQNNKQRLTVENEKISSITRRKFNEIIFGEKHPYGYYVKNEDYDGLERNKLIDYHKQKYSPANCTIIISGLIKPDAVKLLNKNFGSQQAGTNNSSNGQFQTFSSAVEKKHLVERADAIQSGIRIGKPFFNRKHADYPGMAVLNTILGGYFGSRLMSNIREEKGYTYGIGSALVSMKQEGYFFISTEVGTDVTNPTLEEIYKEIELLKTETVDNEELETARNYMLGSFLKGVDGPFQLAERFKSIYFYGLDYSYYDRYIQKVSHIKEDELQDLACRYFDEAGFYELVVGRK
jgi:predicted Zn-dependent peptidase